MTTHVFVVDETTFKLHLKYGFAGTGAGDKTSPFLSSAIATIHSTVERMLVGMIADVSKIRIGDKIIFYLQASGSRQGMFFGVFKATSKAFFDENDTLNYLGKELRKGLSFRVLFEPDEVFSLGITEHEYLDSLQNKNHPSQMCWSLIYRKLKGNRGCTMITDYEFDDLLNKLKLKNNNTILSGTDFTFNSMKDCIELSATKSKYEGRMSSLDIKQRLLFKADKGNAFEVHLQAYLMQNFDDVKIKNLLLPLATQKCWIGNEVSCGVGMQRIDILIKQETESDIYLKIVELKCVDPYSEILTIQIPWYLEWVNDYMIPNYLSKGKNIHVIPCVIAKGSGNNAFVNECKRAKYILKQPSVTVYETEYICFNTSKNDIDLLKK